MRLSVNGVEISEQAVGREMRYHPAESVEAAWKRAVRALVIREILLQAARRDAVEVPCGRPDEEALIQALLARTIRVPEPGEAECRRHFETHAERFRSPPVHRISHILFPAPTQDANARRDALARAEQLLAEIGGEPGTFAEAAMLHSACPSRDAGGDLGWVSRVQTVSGIEQILHKLAPGEIAPHPVETRYGVHLIYLRARGGGEPLPFEAVHRQVAECLRQRARRRAVTRYLQRLVNEARIEGIRLEDAGSPFAP